MESKKLKNRVYTKEIIFRNSAEAPIDADFTMPDYFAEISKILKCRAVSRISSKSVSGRNITVDGVLTVTVIYSDESCRLCSYEHQHPFNKTFEADVDIDGGEIVCSSKCEYINCRAVTSRKIDIHGAVGIGIKVTKRKGTDVITDVDDCNIELRRGVAPATSPMGCAEKYLLIEEEIELSGGQPDIRSVIRYDASVALKECKLLAGKAMVKGDMTVSLLYCSEDGSAQTVRTVIPCSQILEIVGITENCECEAKAEIAFLEIKPRTSMSGETKSLSLNAKILICCETYCNNDVDVVLDAFSKKYEADIKRNDVCFSKIFCNINENFNCKKSISFPEGSLSSVTDMWCDVRIDNTKMMDNSLVINGCVLASIIGVDNCGEPAFFEKAVEFEYKYPLECEVLGFKCEPSVKVISSGYTITSADCLELRMELCVNATVYQCSNMALITDVETDESCELKKTDRGAMTIYFANAGENIWDIARRYLASVREIMEINGIEDEILANNVMIMVPIS
ncbi:MAG: DUF3794 domain-containing protein [Clostridia bacterium]|nr:DUF3794 domain-containing protein [Clostridia bacterium]